MATAEPLQNVDCSGWLTDPLKFLSLCWPGKTLYQKQADVLLSVAENKETFVHSANKVGKTHIAAVTALWFFASRTPARVVLCSSSQSQLENALWREVSMMLDKASVPFPFRRTYCLLEKYKQGTSVTMPLDFMRGQVTSDADRFHGVHLPNDKPRILVIFDEASGVGDAFLEAAQSFAHRILVIGNPMNNNNFFYRFCKEGDVPNPACKGKYLRRVMHIHGADSPNVVLGRMLAESGKLPEPPAESPILVEGILTYEQYKEREVLWDDHAIKTRLYGIFDEGDQRMMFPAGWLDWAMDKGRLAELDAYYAELGDDGRPLRTRKPKAIGVDVAMGGRDRTVWVLIDEHGIFDIIETNEGNAVAIAKETHRLILEYKVPPGRVAIDAGGGGQQIANFMKADYGQSVRIIHFGESPGADDKGKGVAAARKRMRWKEADPRKGYFNRRAEMYGSLRERLNESQGEGIEPFLIGSGDLSWKLRLELQPVPLTYDREGRLKLPPKDPNPRNPNDVSIKQLLGGKSPDISDALVLALHAYRHGTGTMQAIDRKRVEPDIKKMASVQEKIAKRVAAMSRR